MRKPRAPRRQPDPPEEDPLPPSVPPASAGGRRGGAGRRAAGSRSAQGGTGAPTRGGRPRRTAAQSSGGHASTGRGGAGAGSSSTRPEKGSHPATGPEREEGPQERTEHSSELTVFSRRPAIELRREGRADRVVSTGLADRLAERRRALMRLRMRWVLACLLVVALVAALGWGLLFSPLLALRTAGIGVTGSDGSVQDSQVRQILAPYEGRSLLRLDMAELSEKVGDGLVRVRSAQVTRSWPHGLSVELSMRVPVAARHTDAGVEVLDDQAVVLEVAPEAPQGLVTIVAEGQGPGQAGTGGELSAAQVSAVAEVAGALDPQVLARVVSGSATTTGQVTLTLSDGATVVWGENKDNARKSKVLTVLLQTPAAVYDVSSKSPTTSQTPAAQAPAAPGTAGTADDGAQPAFPEQAPDSTPADPGPEGAEPGVEPGAEPGALPGQQEPAAPPQDEAPQEPSESATPAP
ncbi:FtsQ-type POTRA domain-containing protein [Actinomyces bowdenii]|uniref:cell division protein FtsQ/DivIB n=1 Tax=Actinomyces bowdenii TaxID=131109 RepID=UPI00214BF84F|nr:FtsQ-type POTRA domain-containing protein [Actinomyces bowdenii]MCR2052614.1 FtsQ-type POTRA domain-containing protein [Actinomyces bowdenii]